MKKHIREFLQSNRWLKWIPNSLTLCNSLCGFAAILVTLRVYEGTTPALNVFCWSVALILFAMVFDALDGFAARIFNAASLHGLQMDSLADMVTFGVAPATVVAIMTHSLRGGMTPWQEVSVYVLCSVYIGGAALRLATYNVHALLEKKSGDKFSGLPSPGGAAAIASVVLFAPHASIDHRTLALILPIYAAVLGLLMVSKVPYIHAGKWLFSVWRNKNRMVLLIMMLLGVGLFQATGLVVIITLYILSGPLGAVVGLMMKRRRKSCTV